MKLREILAFPMLYRLFGLAVRGSGRKRYVADYLRPTPGMRILDIGCGPADILYDLPDVHYTGIDISPLYIEAARKRHGHRGTFLCEDVVVTADRDPGSADLVMANGVLHHLDDDAALKLLRLAQKALAPGGRFVALDGCFVEDQSRLARFFLDRDRGQFVRTVNEYLALTRQVFGQVESHVRHDLLRIPYTLHIMECSTLVDEATVASRAEWPRRASQAA